ncbi:PQQ-dependent sugar dehydrogenase [Cumulibacter soli]|uniref:PQQ-dependent sugar dehydrogenase n=1 Tax=Cumulibacter soli TaxID=2546344 RepID=UPI001068CC70|nr:PQQ-dependent sugar dehydrogenase [Cumulibacter soli]
MDDRAERRDFLTSRRGKDNPSERGLSAGRSLSRFAALVVPLAASGLMVGCADEPEEAPSGQQCGSASSSADAAGGSVTVLASGLEAPWSIAFDGDTALLSERDSGRILELDGDGAAREVGTIAGVTPMGEGGLLGITVREGFLFAYLTAGDENRLERFDLTGDPGSLGLGEPEVIFDGIPSASYHNGGRIAFGPDDMLYVTVGDAGNSQDAQDLDSLSGKILRLTADGGVPSDNPFDGSPVYSLGHRNPQGLAWDDDTMYATEFGQDTWDELNVIEPGLNYGWPTVEGVADDDRFVDPIQQWSPDDASPSGMTIAAGSIWIANLRGERLREVPLADTSAWSEHMVSEHGRLRDVVGADGSLWVLTNNTDGRGDPGPDDDCVLRIGLD